MLQLLNSPNFMTALICAILLVYFAVTFVLKLKTRKARKLIEYKASLALRAGDLTQGRVWSHRGNGRRYVVLWLTNQTATKPGWEIMITYTNNNRDLYTRSLYEFIHRFRREPDEDNSKDLSLTELLILATHNSKVRTPRIGETWVKEVDVSSDTGGHDVDNLVHRVEAVVTDVLALDTVRPVVTYTVNGKHTAMLLYVFISEFKLKDVPHGPETTA